MSVHFTRRGQVREVWLNKAKVAYNLGQMEYATKASIAEELLNTAGMKCRWTNKHTKHLFYNRISWWIQTTIKSKMVHPTNAPFRMQLELGPCYYLSNTIPQKIFNFSHTYSTWHGNETQSSEAMRGWSITCTLILLLLWFNQPVELNILIGSIKIYQNFMDTKK